MGLGPLRLRGSWRVGEGTLMLQVVFGPRFYRLVFWFTRQRDYGIYRLGMVYAGAGVEGSSLPPDLLQGVDTGARLLARYAREGTESRLDRSYRFRRELGPVTPANATWQIKGLG